jgi:hypothetical protein
MNFLLESAPYITIIFLVILTLIFAIRMIFAVILHLIKKKYLIIRDSILKKKKKPEFEKEEDELLREIPKAHSAERATNLARIKSAQQENDSYELVASQEQQKEKEELNEVKIVDTVKPVGFWSSMILGQKLSYLIKSAQIINKRGRQGFWVSMIEAQEQAAGKQRGHGR